jgi:hypothetical protein
VVTCEFAIPRAIGPLIYRRGRPRRQEPTFITYYFFTGIWIDLDNQETPLSLPTLPGWATPEGWSRGARPSIERIHAISSCVPDDFDKRSSVQLTGLTSSLWTLLPHLIVGNDLALRFLDLDQVAELGGLGGLICNWKMHPEKIVPLLAAVKQTNKGLKENL